jgi:hypothetical protein
MNSILKRDRSALCQHLSLHITSDGAFFQWFAGDEVNGSVSDSTEMVIHRRAEVSVGVTREVSCYLLGLGMTFAILTMQEVEMRIRAGQRPCHKLDGYTRICAMARQLLIPFWFAHQGNRPRGSLRVYYFWGLLVGNLVGLTSNAP